MKAKNCLIFGGSGQIGRNLIRKLTKNNYKVTVVTRNIHQKSYIIKTQANAGYIDIVEANIFVTLSFFISLTRFGASYLFLSNWTI